MRTLKLCAVLVAMAILAGCAGVAKRNANLYATARDADVEQTKAESLAESNATAARATAFAALAAKCPPADGSCVDGVGDKLVLAEAIAALKAAAKPSQSQTRVPYERDLAAKSKDFLTGVTPLASVLGNTWLAGEQSKNARDIAMGDQETQRAIVETVAELGAQPNTVAGGDIIGGDRISDSFNDNSTRGDEIAVSGDGSSVGDGNETVNGDNANNSGNIGEGNRQDSDGPFDDHSDPGDDCTGTDCQGVELPPEPVDPGT